MGSGRLHLKKSLGANRRKTEEDIEFPRGTVYIQIDQSSVHNTQQLTTECCTEGVHIFCPSFLFPVFSRFFPIFSQSFSRSFFKFFSRIFSQSFSQSFSRSFFQSFFRICCSTKILKNHRGYIEDLISRAWTSSSSGTVRLPVQG